MISRIHLISGPRNISTALMYSFGNRQDMSVVDEPFYAYYLAQHPHIDHPGKAETLASLPLTESAVHSDIINGDYPTDYVFYKNMAHHLDGADWTFLSEMKNVFLVRDPKQLIASFAQVIPEPTMLDIGLKLEWELFEHAVQNKADFVVLDSNEVLKDPRKVLTELCTRLDIPFSDDMLNWPAGPRKEDGVWAKYWYDNVHQSTGFAKQKTSSRPFPEYSKPLLIEAQKYYDSLATHAIKA